MSRTPVTASPPDGVLTVDSFHELFVHNPLPMWLFDKLTLRFVEVNEAAVQQYGWSRDEFLQMTLADIRPPEDLPRLLEATRVSREAPASSGFRRSQGWRHRHKDGSTVWVDIYSHDFWHGNQLMRLAMIHDVTELKQAAEQLEQKSAFFSQLFHNSPEAIVMLDGADRVLDANRAFLQMRTCAAVSSTSWWCRQSAVTRPARCPRRC
jgi:PAS domain S-box-containing protein